MKLDALGGKLAVADRHHLPVWPERCCALEAVRQLRIDHQRVVAPDLQRVLKAREDRPPIVLDRVVLPCTGSCGTTLPPHAWTSAW